MIEIIGSELNQWDDKRAVKVTNSVATHVHLANQGDSAAVVMELADSQALIPNYLLCTGKQLCVYAVANGVTIERKVFSVRKRERPEDYVYDKDNRNYIYKLITDAQTATEAANQATKDANEAADKANQAAKSWVIMGEVKGESVVIDDAIDQTFAGFRIFGSTTQDGTPTPEAPVDLVSVENPTVSVNEQSMLVPYTLHGIPVSNGGNYIDSNGQQWVCDEVDFARGVYVRRCEELVIDGSGYIGVGQHSNGQYYCTQEAPGVVVLEGNAPKMVLCDRYIASPWTNANNKAYCIGRTMVLTDNRFIDKATAITILSVEKPKCLYALSSPIETPLSDEELAAYATLYTSRYGTTVSNDKNAYMDIHYYMDAKKYIDSVVGTGGSSAGLVNATVE